MHLFTCTLLILTFIELTNISLFFTNSIIELFEEFSFRLGTLENSTNQSIIEYRLHIFYLVVIQITS